MIRVVHGSGQNPWIKIQINLYGTAIVRRSAYLPFLTTLLRAGITLFEYREALSTLPIMLPTLATTLPIMAITLPIIAMTPPIIAIFGEGEAGHILIY